MVRGSVKNQSSKLIGVWVPVELVDAMEAVIKLEDSDRSKFVRNAIRHRISKYRIPIKQTAE